MDYYRVLGLDPKLQLDLNGLQQLFYARSRELHPDRFARAEASVRDAGLIESSLLNDAYRTLRDPLARAEYILKENGFDVGLQGTKDVPPELLEEVFDLNMALEELKAGDESARPQLSSARDSFEAMLAQSSIELDKLFSAYDASPGTEPLKPIRALLNRRRYIQNLLRDVHGYLSN